MVVAVVATVAARGNMVERVKSKRVQKVRGSSRVRERVKSEVKRRK